MVPVLAGATCVTEWDAKTGTNIVWKTAMPGAGMAQPLIIGEKAITTADPNLLICVNMHDGTIIWQTAIDHTTAMPKAQATLARKEIAFWKDAWIRYARWRQGCEKLEALVLSRDTSQMPYGRKRKTLKSWRNQG